MAKYLSIAEAQDKLGSISAELDNEPVVITKLGKPIMVTFAYEQIESLFETLEILENQEFSFQLQRSLKQDKQGEVIDWEEAKTKMGW